MELAGITITLLIFHWLLLINQLHMFRLMLMLMPLMCFVVGLTVLCNRTLTRFIKFASINSGHVSSHREVFLLSNEWLCLY